MKSKLVTLIVLSLTGLAQTVSAQGSDEIRLGIPSYGGNGCPAGSAAIALNDDASALAVLFDRFIVEAGGNTGRKLDRRNCNLAIPVHVPEGFSVSVLQVDYRGFNSLPPRAQSTFNVEYFFAGKQGSKFSRTFTGALHDEFFLDDELTTTAWSRCGQDVILRTNASLVLRNVDTRVNAISSIDSADIKAGVVYRLQWRRC